MPKNHENFHSANGKRRILIVDDERINRELLGVVLRNDYEIIYATNGQEALDQIRQHRETLSLVLLDLLMPVLSGIEVLRHLKDDPELRGIPVIVLTSDQSAEIESLSLGAIDFIPKPYPQPDVIQARVLRTIELCEDREIIQYTERDALTGLYNREYFYRYAVQFDQHHKDMEMDAIIVDVNHFHMINERYGKAYGDAVLRRIGEKLREMVRDSGGIVCRREADIFMVYCPHRTDYKDILDNASIGLAGDAQAENRVRLRMGVYSAVDKSIDIDRRFDRAKSASDTVRGSFTQTIGIYDSALLESELYAERLIEDFQTAIREQQFLVFYQPKFDVRPEIPVLSSAEALVRWKHPELGMISPGVFVPLFEENGLIQQLDNYVWRAAAAQIKDWRTRLGISVPVSVNVSRVDMYDSNLIDTFQGLLREFDLKTGELLLEITESAYTDNSEQIISTVNRLRELGFRIEMDDFGTGYSSLNMISTLPIDALKLDMQFIRNAFKEGKDTRMIEVIIDIADYLSVPVIAEGVETEEQLNALKDMGCDIVQGYYFSKPVPANEYERFVEEKKSRTAPTTPVPREKKARRVPQQADYINIAHALTTGFESIYYVDTDSGSYVEFSSKGRYEDLQIERGGDDFFGDTQRNIPRVVHVDDQDRVSLCMRKEALLPQLAGDNPFSMTYRLVINNEPLYYNLRAVNANSQDNHHIVIGVSNVEDQMHRDRSAAVSQKSREFYSIAQALSSDFESIYYVDMQTENYSEFTAKGLYEDLRIDLSGSNFFAECQKNLLAVVYPEDQPKVSAVLSRDYLRETLAEEPNTTLIYRLVIDGSPVYYRMKIVRAEDDGRHIVIGVSNISAQIAREQEYELSRKSGVTFSRIAQALSRNYFSIYYVDIETEHFWEYSAAGKDHKLTLLREADDFFGACKRDIPRMVVREDQEKAMAAFDRETLLKEVADQKTFSIEYRLIIDGKPLYAGLKAIRMLDDPNHLVIGVSDIDAQMRYEQEFRAVQAQNVTFSSIAQALAADYFSIYYVDIETDRFIEYSSHAEYDTLNIEKGGEDFFALSRKNILRVVHPEDHQKILAAFTKEKLLKELEKTGTFTLDYRLMFDGKPNYVSMKATRMSEDDKHIVIGVNNINAQMQRQREYEAARAQNLTYSRIAQALSKDYYSIYYVNTETDEFIEYSSHSDYQELQVEQSGVDFFEDCRRNIMRLVYKEDLNKALAVWDKSRLMPALENGQTFSTTYRLMMDGEPVYINCKVIRMTDGEDDKHIVIGVSNVDAQMRREHELTVARNIANRDQLTGVKSKHAYSDQEDEIDESIASGTAMPFAVVVCDVNGLKEINDSRGHAAGDALIKSAAAQICGIFSHSPVYRYGGDEFVVLLRGQDFNRRVALMDLLAEKNRQNAATGGPVIASGISDFNRNEDENMAAVFSRADTSMYENKRRLKGNR